MRLKSFSVNVMPIVLPISRTAFAALVKNSALLGYSVSTSITRRIFLSMPSLTPMKTRSRFSVRWNFPPTM